MFTLNNRKDTSPLCVNLHINHEELNFEVDTGAAMTVMNEKKFKTLNKNTVKPLEESKVQLRTYTGDRLQVLGTTEVEVRYENQSATLPLLIVAGEVLHCLAGIG